MSRSEFPVRYVHGNVIFGRGDQRAAVYRLPTVSFPFLPDADKIRAFKDLARLSAALETDFSLYRVTRSYPADEYVDQARGMVDERFADPEKWEAYLLGQQEHIKGLRPFAPEVYLIVNLAEARRQGVGQGTVDRTTRARQAVQDRVHKSARVLIRQRELEDLDERDERTLQRIQEYVSKAERATVREIQWLMRRGRCRGLGEPQVDRNWVPSALVVRSPDGEPAVQPTRTDVIRHQNVKLRESAYATLPVQSEEGLSHQAMLGLGALPETSMFPGGAELLFTPLERVSFPVDAVVHARFITNREAVTRVRRRVVDADVAYAGQASSMHGPLSWALEENRAYARDLDGYLTSDAHPPLLDVTISLALGAPDEKTLKQRVDRLRAAYGSVKLEQPTGLQERMFLDHLPRADAGSVRDYADVLTVEQLGALMPTGTHDAGHDRGFLLARTTSYGNRPIKNDITRAPKQKRPPAIYICAGLGGGKTFLAQLMCIGAALRGSRVVTIDPKPDHNLENVPELRGMVNVIQPSASDVRHVGMLDPLVVSPTHIREDRGVSFYLELMGNVPAAWETQVRKATKLVLTGEQPCSLRVVDALLKSPHEDARAAGETLGVWADSGLARLGFGDGVDRVGSSFPVTTIRPQDLTLPRDETPRANYDAMERVSVGVLKLVAGFAMKLLGQDSSVHKVFMFDELGKIATNPDGHRLVEQINLYGRSMNSTLIMLAQLNSMVGNLEKLVGERWIGGQETEEEARTGLKLIGLDPNNRQMVDRVMGYTQGRFLYRDVDGHVAEVQATPVYEHLLEALDSSPDAAPEVVR